METVTIQPATELETSLQELLEIQPESGTILHCRLFSDCTHIRIWPSTFLIQQNGERKKLVKSFKITIMPQWTFAKSINNYIYFTLIFEGLDKNCSSFHMLEDIPEPGFFYTATIARNQTDVYNVETLSDL